MTKRLLSVASDRSAIYQRHRRPDDPVSSSTMLTYHQSRALTVSVACSMMSFSGAAFSLGVTGPHAASDFPLPFGPRLPHPHLSQFAFLLSPFPFPFSLAHGPQPWPHPWPHPQRSRLSMVPGVGPWASGAVAAVGEGGGAAAPGAG